MMVDPNDETVSLTESEEIDRIADRFEAEFRSGKEPRIEAYLDDFPGDRMRLLRELVGVELELRQEVGGPIEPEEYYRRFPIGLAIVRSVIAERFPTMEPQDLAADFHRQWTAEPSLTAEAYASMLGIDCSQELFERLLQEELRLRMHRFAAAGSHEAKSQTERNWAAVGANIPTQIGRYEVLGLIAEGGFGSVYHARDSSLDREVAIKAPRLDSPLGEKAHGEFEREARLLCRLEHPHILPVYDFGMTGDNRPYLVVKLVKSETLASRLDRGDLSFFEATFIASSIARALHYAHGMHVVHRDVKPRNILLDETGHPWLTDFGLGLESPRTDLISDNSGTPPYWSPEQAAGRANLVDGRSDIFSLGIILYEAITHTHPFQDKSIQGIKKRILHADVRPPRQINDRIPKQLEDACLRALRRDPTERYSTAEDFAEDLDEVPTYKPNPIDTANVQLPSQFGELVENLAINTHEIWASRRLSEGWVVGEKRDDRKKTHPDLIPFEQLSKTEQDYDRDVVESVLKAAIALGVKIELS